MFQLEVVDKVVLSSALKKVSGLLEDLGPLFDLFKVILDSVSAGGAGLMPDFDPSPLFALSLFPYLVFL